MNLEDLATSVDASEIHDTTDMGRLTSPLFSQEREVSGIKFTVSCSQTHSSVERPMRDVDPFSSVEKSSWDVEPFSSFGKPLSKGKDIENWRECNILKWKRERILSEQRNTHDILEQKADQAFQGEFVVQTRLSEAQSELDRRGWRMRNADIAL